MITSHKKLYKKDSNQNIRVWWMESENNKFRTCSGVYEGEIVVTEWTICEPKNVGKKNETTAEEQCLLEIAANYKKKLAQGNYKETLDEDSLNQDNYIKPMLAKEYGTDYEYIEGSTVFSQPKLDGCRAIATSKGFFSRQGKPIISTPHVLEELKTIFQKYPDIVLDGELYSDKLSDNFNEIISLARKTKPEAEDLLKSKEFLQYWIYDFISDKPFEKRHEELKSFIAESSVIKFVETIKVTSKEELDNCYARYMEQGYEGQMIRISNKGYENKRTKQLIKRKEFKEEEFKLIDIVEGDGNRSGMAGNVLLETNTGKQFGAGIQGNREVFKELLKNKSDYLETLVSVKYQNLTPDGIPRFPVAVKFWKTKKREI